MGMVGPSAMGRFQQPPPPSGPPPGGPGPQPTYQQRFGGAIANMMAQQNPALAARIQAAQQARAQGLPTQPMPGGPPGPPPGGPPAGWTPANRNQMMAQMLRAQNTPPPRVHPRVRGR